MYLLGENDSKPKNAEWAEKICGVSADQIKSIARKISKERTLITVAWSLQRAQNGEQPYWMATTLAAMLGQVGLPGGGIGFGYGAIGGIEFLLKTLVAYLCLKVKIMFLILFQLQEFLIC